MKSSDARRAMSDTSDGAAANVGRTMLRAAQGEPEGAGGMTLASRLLRSAFWAVIGLALGLALGLLAWPRQGAAETWRLPDFWPNAALAVTHDLHSADGAYVLHAQFITPQQWGRSFDYLRKPCNVDWQQWVGEGLYYTGYFYDCNWSSVWYTPSPPVPATITLEPGQILAYTFAHLASVQTQRGAGGAFVGATCAITTWTVAITETSLDGELTLLIDFAGGAESETWWFARCITVMGGGCAPGLRRVRAMSGVAMLDVRYVRWVAR